MANRPHHGLRDPASPQKPFTPNEKYAALVEGAGYVRVAFAADDYVELLQARWHAINAYGVKLNHRTYDCEALNPLRQQKSGIIRRKHLWEIHYDPYDVTRVWVRDHWNGGWITVPWRHLGRAPVPFGELAWNHARANLPNATEAELADAVAALLTRPSLDPPDLEGELRDLPKRIDVPTLAAWNAKEDLLDLLALARTQPNREDVADLLYRFYRRCAQAGLPELERLATTVQGWWPEILTFIRTGITNEWVSYCTPAILRLLIRRGARSPTGHRKFADIVLNEVASVSIPDGDQAKTVAWTTCTESHAC